MIYGGDDRISDLPDGVLQHILGFLESLEAVRTSVLARRWRDLWRSMPVLRLTRPRVTVGKLRVFLRSLREPSSRLDMFLLNCYADMNDDVSIVKLGIRRALSCRVWLLSISMAFSTTALRKNLQLDPISSTYLRKIELDGLDLNEKFLDFSGCQRLLKLKLDKCRIEADRIFSPSLKNLDINECEFSRVRRTRILVPSLFSLELCFNVGRTPLLEDMPLLESAEVYLDSESMDACDNDCPGYCSDDECVNCYGTDDGSTGCVLLNGLAAATTLELIAYVEEFILKRDLRFCPTFSNLKILEVCTWCVEVDQRALICILQHTPVLEKLKMDLLDFWKEPKEAVRPKEIYNSVGTTFELEHIKSIELTCCDIDRRVRNIMKLLITCGIPIGKISIHCKNEYKGSDCFSFVCTDFMAAQV